MASPATEAGPHRPTLAPTPRSRASAATLALLACAQLIISIDYNIVYVALPRIGSDLGFSAAHLQWVISAYAVAFGGFLLLGGRATDHFGPRRIFVTGLGVYGVASLAGGLATGPGLLIAARAAQGIGGALLFPATLTLVSTLFTQGRERNRAYSVWGAAGGSGLLVGALLGGVLTQLLGWRSVLYVNVPLTLIAATAALGIIPADTARRTGRRIDLPGALTSTLGITGLVVALVQGPESGWLSATTLLPAAAGTVLLAAFLLIESRTPAPLMPLPLLRDRALRTGTAVTFLYMATIGSIAYFLTLYFHHVLGYDALRAGLAYLVPMLAITAGSLLAGRAATRFGTRAAMTGSLALAASGTAMVALIMATDGSYTSLIPGFLVLGLGQGAGYTLMFAAATATIPIHDQGIASGIASTAQQIGGAVGLALLVGLAGHGEQAQAAALVDGLRTALLAAAAGITLTALLALRFPRRTSAGSPSASPARRSR
ncbi:MFS transporter [Streptomyces parvulus]|uniref:MFS transporter n=1 Tax=Streptomyces parvulus TaxID=146923 RepID=UPI0037B47C60